MAKEFKEIINDKSAESVSNTKGRKLTAKNSTFNLDDGSYKGTITDAFWYKNASDRDKVMLMIQLNDENATEFKNSVDGDWIEDYPFSELLSQASIDYVEDFVGLKVKFEIRNHKGNELTFSNIKQISLDLDE